MGKYKQQRKKSFFFKFFENLKLYFQQIQFSTKLLSKKIYKTKTFKKIKKFLLGPLIGRILEILQLTLIYLIPILSLTVDMYRVLHHNFPIIFSNLMLFKAQDFFNYPILLFLSNPNNTFLFYYFVFEIYLGPLGSKKFKISTIVKYNLILALILEMVLNLSILIWDFLNSLQIYSSDYLIGGNQIAFFQSFLIFVYPLWYFLYLYFYILSLTGRFPVINKSTFFSIPRKVFDSIAFWIRLRRN